MKDATSFQDAILDQACNRETALQPIYTVLVDSKKSCTIALNSVCMEL